MLFFGIFGNYTVYLQVSGTFDVVSHIDSWDRNRHSILDHLRVLIVIILYLSYFILNDI